MGLFGGKKDNKAIENELLQKMSRLPFLDGLILEIFSDEAPAWLTKCQGDIDSCKRVVTVDRDSVTIEWKAVSIDAEGVHEHVFECVSYSLTKSGYKPLCAHYNEKGRIDVPMKRVCYLFASIIRERMESKMPNSEFTSVTASRQISQRDSGSGVLDLLGYASDMLVDDNIEASFVYSVPPQELKDWL